MIITKIQGGLGNQIFQWSYSRSLSIDLNTDLFFDLSFYNKNFSGIANRKFELDKIEKIKLNTNIPIINSPIYKIDDDFNYKNHHLKDNTNYYLDGYWQSEKYFDKHKDIILKELEPSTALKERLLKTPLLDTNTISIHIRRGDYINSNGYHPVQSLDYYKKAIDIIGDYDYIFVFSDDINWCKENLKFNNMVFIEGMNEIEDLYLISMCKNNIIANSTFSWWGAWLNKNIEKKVIAPKLWFGENANLNSDDIIPESWIKI